VLNPKGELIAISKKPSKTFKIPCSEAKKRKNERKRKRNEL
jgi:hypothetical protein